MYFRKLAQVYLIPHQGSSSSTSEGITKVFEKANKFQKTTSKQFPVASVVLLDEVGLAETSPFNPLKVLHSLLEPSYPATGPTVSVIGIFNWRLDISKSSRALLVQRPQFNLNDLVDTAERLLNTRVIGQRLVLEPLAKAYEKNGSQFPDDQEDYYYSVLRRIMMCVEAGRPLILTDLETIYGSLYDLWDQNYIVVRNKDNVKYFTRVALGAYSNPMLYVSPNFKFGSTKPFEKILKDELLWCLSCIKYQHSNVNYISTLKLDILKQVLENDDGLIENHLEDFKNNLISIYPNFEYLQKYSELYYNDFIKINLSIYSTKLDFILRHLIGTEDKIVNPFVLHIYWWKYAAEILIQLKLVETFPDLITKAQNDFIVYGKLDRFLFNESINLILKNICDDKPWKQDMDFISSIYYKINDSKNFSNLHLLFLCNDLLKINTTPLEKVKEIINLGKSTKNKEIITTEIINLVFSNLDNNNNEIPITSFIKRSLNLISLESEIRLTLYKHIFSQYSFKLMNNGIIEKIFTTEIQQNKQIFFILIKNSKKALQFSIRLKTINDNINDINSNMAWSCCEIIQSIFNQFELSELLPYFKNSIESFTNQEDLLLQQITSIAFLKEFINKYWKNYFQKDNSLSNKVLLI
ncbi:unnamed protein product [Rhizophagus irregularis]|nr:unnamed protein product [Rhizophagus irregularis]